MPMASENLAGLSNVPDVEAEVLSDTFASVPAISCFAK